MNIQHKLDDIDKKIDALHIKLSLLEDMYNVANEGLAKFPTFNEYFITQKYTCNQTATKLYSELSMLYKKYNFLTSVLYYKERFNKL